MGNMNIDNDIIEHLAKINLSPYEWRVLMAILRKTYGYAEMENGQAKKDENGHWVKKKMDAISYSQFEELTGLEKRNIAKAIQRLVQKNIIKKEEGKIVRYGLQENYELWNGVRAYTTSKESSINPNNDSMVSADTPVSTDTPEVVSAHTPEVVSVDTPTKKIFKRNNIFISKDISQNSFDFEVQNSFSNNLKDFKDLKNLPTPPISADPPLPQAVGKKLSRSKKETKEIEEVLQEVDPEKKQVGKKEVLSLISQFCEVMKFPFNKDTIAKNYQYAKELLQVYTAEEIIKAVQQGIEIYKKQGKPVPAVYIPTLASVKNMIHVWLAEAKKKEQRRNNGYEL